MKHILSLFDGLFSFFVFLTIFLLACYMAVRIGVGGFTFFENLLAGSFFTDELVMEETSRRALHAIAETVILIKAYRILVSYLRRHHISVEYIVEISIIAPAIELLFAYDMYDVQTKIIFAVFGLINLFAYLYFFGPEHDEDLHRSIRNGHQK